MADTNPGEAVLARAVSASRNTPGSRLIAAYALGSLAHGGRHDLVARFQRWRARLLAPNP